MLNYIQAEFYKLLHRKYTYIALGIFLLLEGLLAAGFAFHNSHSYATPFGRAVVMIVDMGTIGFCTCLLTGDIVFAGQHKNSTLKNEVSFGLSRTRIYLGKFIAQTLLSIGYLVVMMGFFIGLCAAVLPMEGPGFYSAGEALAIVGYFLAVGLPLWIAAQAVACMCQFLINGDLASSFAYVGIVLVLDSIFQIMGLLIRGRTGDFLLKICEYLPRPMLEGAKSVVGNWNYLSKAWAVGVFWAVACTAIGLYGFKRKEIK